MVTVPYLGADIPNQFSHSNIVAVLVPTFVLIDNVERDGNSIRFHFTGPAPNNYTVEATESLTLTNWVPLTMYQAKTQAIDVVVSNAFTNAQARFFRVRQDPYY